MIEQLIRSIEMVCVKQLKLITGNDPKYDTHRVKGHGIGPKTELWIGVRDDTVDYKERQFKITVEEIVDPPTHTHDINPQQEDWKP